MKYTLAVTCRCNLRCRYCYINKHAATMSLETADRIVDFIFRHTPQHETIDIGFFGGEPLLEFDLIQAIVQRIQRHDSYDASRMLYSLVTNGTIFSETIAADLHRHRIALGISCDGPAHAQNSARVFPDGAGSSAIVENTIRQALHHFPFLPVNAVYTPKTVDFLPDIVDYFYGLGVRNIYLNPDISARWTQEHANRLPGLFRRIGSKYLDYYHRGTPCHINLIDSKITVILRGGYEPLEKCRMGKGEFAFAPSGNIYPCERLIGGDEKGNRHCLGNVHTVGATLPTCRHNPDIIGNMACRNCGLNRYCMHWCGCTNSFATGDYHTAGPFICASEKAAIAVAGEMIATLDAEGFPMADHLAGTPLMSILGEMGAASRPVTA